MDGFSVPASTARTGWDIRRQLSRFHEGRREALIEAKASRSATRSAAHNPEGGWVIDLEGAEGRWHAANVVGVMTKIDY